MDGILEWGYDLIQWMQQLSPALDTLFKVITSLGTEDAFLLLLPLIFWCLDKRRGMQLGLLLMISAYINFALKDLFNQPRPATDRVKVLIHETSPGLPSGHAQNSAAVYGFLAAWTRRPQAWAIAGLGAFGVGLSRIYLGVHFPSDVLGGWLLGVTLLALYLWIESNVAYGLRAWPWGYKMALAISLPLGVFVVYATEESAQLLGAVLGLTTGMLVELRWVKFSAGGAPRQRAARYIVGVAILIAVWLGFKVVFPEEPETIGLVFRLIRYALVGAWASLGAPWLFVRTGLAPRESDAGG